MRGIHHGDMREATIDLEEDASWGYDLATARNDYEYLDTLMEQVWGKDNRGAQLVDELEGQASRHRKRRRWVTKTAEDGTTERVEEADILNVARYSRFYQNADKDAMGFQQRRRGYNDRYLWAARTTQDRVSGVTASFGKAKHDDKEKLAQTQRWSYALPLEIVYTTPLTKWNPYNITDHTEAFHEAFAAQVLCNVAALEDEEFLRNRAGVSMKPVDFPWDRLNPNGGSVALGHPFGATGARILSQATAELAAMPKGSRAIVSICADGGLGTVALLEHV